MPVDPATLWAYFFDAVGLLNAIGIVTFLFVAVYSRYVRPFLSESIYNFRLSLVGKYSIRTGKVKPGTIPWEKAHPDQAAGLVDSALEWAKIP